MLTCRQVAALASDYLDRRLRARQRFSMLLHVLMCRGCREYLRQLQTTIAALRATPQPATAIDVPEGLMGRFRAATRGTGDEGPAR